MPSSAGRGRRGPRRPPRRDPRPPGRRSRRRAARARWPRARSMRRCPACRSDGSWRPARSPTRRRSRPDRRRRSGSLPACRHRARAAWSGRTMTSRIRSPIVQIDSGLPWLVAAFAGCMPDMITVRARSGALAETCGRLAAVTGGVVLSESVARALRDGDPVVALESTIITHGLPRPENLQAALEFEQTVADSRRGARDDRDARRGRPRRPRARRARAAGRAPTGR